MSVGTKWRHQAERAGAEQARRLLDAAARELGDLLPGAQVERGTNELRIGALQLMRRWIAEPGLRFLARSLK